MPDIKALRESYQRVADHEARLDPSPQQKREKIKHYRGHLTRWDAACDAAGVKEPCPFAALLERWQAELDGTAPPADLSKSAPKKNGAGKATESEEGEGDAESGEPPLLPPRIRWLESHALIVKVEVPAVKARAGDPDDYLKAKGEFLKRNAPILKNYIAQPAKAPSPLFTYVALYLFDGGNLAGALDVCETAIRMRQPSALKRDFHQLQWDLQFEQLQRDAEEAASTIKADSPKYKALLERRALLMKSAFRGEHAKAKLNKTVAQLAHALGDNTTAEKLLLSIKFLDPQMGVDTLLGSVRAALSGNGLGEHPTGA